MELKPSKNLVYELTHKWKAMAKYCGSGAHDAFMWCADELLKAAAQWNSRDGAVRVEDRLPEIDEWVHAYDSYSKRWICARLVYTGIKDETAWADDDLSYYSPGVITHWMPMPPSPEGGRE